MSIWRIALGVIAAALAIAITGCRSAQRAESSGRFLMTDAPVDFEPNGGGICLAVDPSDRNGIWWWQPGPTGCASRSTGPNLFRADATFSGPTSGSVTTVAFGLSVHSTTRPFVTLMFVFDDDSIRVPATNATVGLHRRADLDVRWS
ncbi:MAG: hypothetical protein ACRD1V_20400, partial [Vicinamibacterales bacterium]